MWTHIHHPRIINCVECTRAAKRRAYAKSTSNRFLCKQATAIMHDQFVLAAATDSAVLARGRQKALERVAELGALSFVGSCGKKK